MHLPTQPEGRWGWELTEGMEPTSLVNNRSQQNEGINGRRGRSTWRADLGISRTISYSVASEQRVYGMFRVLVPRLAGQRLRNCIAEIVDVCIAWGWCSRDPKDMNKYEGDDRIEHIDRREHWSM